MDAMALNTADVSARGKKRGRASTVRVPLALCSPSIPSMPDVQYDEIRSASRAVQESILEYGTRYPKITDH